MTVAVVPVKNLSEAKSRLTPLLDAVERKSLVRIMLSNVLAALLGAKEISSVFVVAAEDLDLPDAVALIREPGNRGYDEAISFALSDPRVAGAKAMLIVPGDLPLLGPGDIDTLLDDVKGREARIARARDGDGTNALLLAPPDLMPTSFGPGSCQLHRQTAFRCGCAVEVFTLDGLAFDIDTPQDLVDFRAREGETGTHAFLRRCGVVDRLADTINDCV